MKLRTITTHTIKLSDGELFHVSEIAKSWVKNNSGNLYGIDKTAKRLLTIIERMTQAASN